MAWYVSERVQQAVCCTTNLSKLKMNFKNISLISPIVWSNLTQFCREQNLKYENKKVPINLSWFQLLVSGGIMLMETVKWAAHMNAINSLPLDPNLNADWLQIWKDRLQTRPALTRNWLNHQLRDDYWKHGSVCEDYSRIKAATFLWGGYADGYTNSVDRTLNNITCPKRAIIGPWLHLYPQLSGNLEPRWEFRAEAVKWWDRFLKEKPMEEDPNLICFVQDNVPLPHRQKVDGRWIAEPKSSMRMLYLAENKRLQDTPGTETVSFCTDETCGESFGSYFPLAVREISADQAHDDELSCVFETEETDKPFEMVGRPVVTLSVASDKPVANIVVRLCVVDPNGKSRLIGYSGFNLNHNQSHEEMMPLKPGEFKDVKIQLDFVGERINKSHKLRLCASSAYFPLFLPNPEHTTLTLDLSKCQLNIPVLIDCEELKRKIPETAPHTGSSVIKDKADFQKNSTINEAGELAVTRKSHTVDRLVKIGLTTERKTTQTESIHPKDPTSVKLKICHEMVW